MLNPDALQHAIKKLKQPRPLWSPGQNTVDVTYNKPEIHKILEHRPPFSLLDGISQIDLEQAAIKGHSLVHKDNPVFKGHFPGNPVYPGVLQIEIMGQMAFALAYFMQNNTCFINEDVPPIKALFTKTHHAAFIHPVYPGERLEILAKAIAYDDLSGTFSAQLFKAETLCSYLILEIYFKDE